METLLLLCYAALSIAIFKIFRIPLNKWTVPTAVLGGVVLIGALILGMNYNFPYTDIGKQVFRTVPVVSQTRGRVMSVPVQPNQMLHKGDVLFTLDPTPFQAQVDDLTAQVKAASQDALSLNAALNSAQADLQKAVALRDRAQREYARFQAGHDKGAFSDQMVDTRRQSWKADEAAVAAAQASVVQAHNNLNSVVNGENTKVASLLAQLRAAEFKLENTVVRAPSDGYVSTVGLRPGTMSTALGLKPVMTFVPTGEADKREFVAAFRQNSLQRLEKGEQAELLFPAVPGTVFHAEVTEVLPAIGESQFQGQGTLLTTRDLDTRGRALVVFRVTDTRLQNYHLPQGTDVEAAVYSGHLEHLSLIRKILIRMKSWENYLYLDH
ncbi:HlyD family secretion protein [Raoultella ornithinolytica]|jgi:multidrug resistance efflux pump|uniref:HlyD family secretion protein n=1 Tax=Raoultella TaxID=160674 RepID=UPI000EE1B416|nr:HlyD family secretion protein [Raoultella ornithinolytica]AYW53799.1 HlyD family secretion protein [Raoultella ornithinolytica]EKQ8000027.1 HlyD family secretion protein [Raoultella ornithinolytica]EKT9521489.1 HlyD family secretion protein [Raoultella ornithinolytica]EKU0196318.1 HlyD family secretion protein [Raoultella ornithinolytica]EKV4099766.1 HlyD family secretion protein [Raoultella ornithinolytica]